MLQPEHLQEYQRRLINLGQGNRALKHLRLSARRDIDLEAFSYLEGKPVDALLWDILQGRKTTLIKQVSARAEQANVLDTRLKKVHRTLMQTEAETGLYDFNLGYAYIEGQFADGSICRAPLLLLPVRLVKGQARNRWQLELREPGETLWNTVFLRAYERYTDVRLPEDFWTRNPLEGAVDLQDVLNKLYTAIKDFDLQIDFQSQTHTQHVVPFRDLLAATAAQFKQGILKLKPYAVLGVYPQSDAAILADYDTLSTWQDFPTWPAAPNNTPKIDDCPKDEYLCLPVDESQLRALRAVRAGESIALQGPPGTGKSQWIVNLVGDYLMRNKRVLVVSQKRAALEVVHQRLRALNFGAFCYLIHDFREDRRRIYSQLAEFLESLPAIEQRQQQYNIARAQREYETLGAQIQAALDNLGDFGKTVTTVRHHGLTVLDLYDRIDHDAPYLTISFALTDLHDSDLEALALRMQQLLAYHAVFVPEHPWSARKNLAQFDSKALRKWRHLADHLPEVCQQLEKSYAALSKAGHFMLDRAGFDHELAHYLQIVERLLAAPDELQLLEQWMQTQLTPDARTTLHSNIVHLANAIESAQYVSLADLQMGERLRAHTAFYLEKRQRLLAFLSADFRTTKSTLRSFFEGKGYSLSTVDWEVFQAEIQLLTDFKKIVTEDSLSVVYSPIYQLLSVNDIQEKLQKIDAAVVVHRSLAQLKSWPVHQLDIQQETPLHSQLESLVHDLKVLEQEAKDWRKRTAQLHYYFGTEITAEFVDCVRKGDSVCRNHLAQLRLAAATDYEQLLMADQLLAALTDEAQAIFTAVIQPIIADAAAPELAALQQGIYRNWLHTAEREAPIIQQTDAKHYTLELELLRTRWQRRQALAQELVLYTLQTQVVDRQEYNRLGNPVTYREIRHQVNKRRQIWPIRKLIAQAWDSGLDHLMPCVLASPETVSAVFPMQADCFDLVVFDEASQCAVERALPAMLRAPQTAVVGDHQQLQPLDLFRAEAQTTAADDLQSAVWQESESLLDLARQQFSEYMLTWHYRSRVQQLVRFSNHAFYHNRLQVLPAMSLATELKPLVYHTVPGRWEHNVNRLEADAIVSRTLHLMRESPELSVGIVSFNQRQQDLVLDLLENAIPVLYQSGDEKVAKALEWSLHQTEADSTGREPLLVKNIENVQGNERDVILFTIGYGPIDNGTISANFGLLNRLHGENRLNVAITRARRRIEIFASFKPWELNVAHTKHDGPKLLKQYLHDVYDQSLLDWPPEPTVVGIEMDDRIALIDSMLQERGYTLTHLGDGFQEPFFGIRKAASADYIAGVMVTQQQFYDQPSALARTVFRPLQLASREWPVYYLWARQLWRDPQAAIDSILQRIENSDT